MGWAGPSGGLGDDSPTVGAAETDEDPPGATDGEDVDEVAVHPARAPTPNTPASATVRTTDDRRWVLLRACCSIADPPRVVLRPQPPRPCRQRSLLCLADERGIYRDLSRWVPSCPGRPRTTTSVPSLEPY